VNFAVAAVVGVGADVALLKWQLAQRRHGWSRQLFSQNPNHTYPSSGIQDWSVECHNIDKLWERLRNCVLDHLQPRIQSITTWTSSGIFTTKCYVKSMGCEGDPCLIVSEICLPVWLRKFTCRLWGCKSCENPTNNHPAAHVQQSPHHFSIGAHQI
jgi:hypothetical protein